MNLKENNFDDFSQFTTPIIDEIGDNHIATSLDTPMKKNAFAMTDSEKMAKIQMHFRQIMDTLGLDLTDDSLSGTPSRVAKMFVTEIFSGLDPKNKPSVALFENKYEYNQMLVEKNILVQSTCEHHFLPIYGKAHVAYIPNNKVVGLSKLNRIVQYYCKRPQVQERLTTQIANELIDKLDTKDVAVYIDAKHMCVSSRGIKDISSSTVTSYFSGQFKKEEFKQQFLSSFRTDTDY